MFARRLKLLYLTALCSCFLISIFYAYNYAYKRVEYHVNENFKSHSILETISENSFMCRIAISKQFNPVFADILENVTQHIDVLGDLTKPTHCELFKQINGVEPAVSEEELQFPIAFSYNVHKEFDQVARMIRAMYRKHNAYCIHLDSKADPQLRAQLRALVTCLGPNVHLIPAEQSHNMRWGDLSTLEAWILCATHLLRQSPVRWRYLLNGSGQEFPLRTNWELVKALKAINGSNILESAYPDTGKPRAPSVPLSFNFTWIKGSFYTALRRDMVEFSLTNKYAVEILRALRTEGDQIKCQDEVFFTTLNYNAHFGAPGGCSEVHHPNDADPRSVFVGRYAEWLSSPSCLSRRAQRGVCIQGVRNLPQLITRPEFVVNKFIYDFQPLAYDCLEWWLFEKIKYERNRGETVQQFNTSFYSDLYCSKNHL